MKNCKLFLRTGNAKQVEQLDTLIQDKGSKITNIWSLLSDNILYIANDGIQLILRLINEIMSLNLAINLSIHLGSMILYYCIQPIDGDTDIVKCS